MAKKETHSDQAVKLRKQAEKIAKKITAKSPDKTEAMSPKEMRQTLHELRVHQIELEIQNEELRRSQVELENARARYFDLYDLAPVGYLTISGKGLILESNLSAANLLGVSRKLLAGQLFTRFISKEDQDTYYIHRKRLLETDESQSWEMRMVNKGGKLFWAHLEVAAEQNVSGASVSRVVLSDINEQKSMENSLRQSHELLEQRVEERTEQLLNSEEKYRRITENMGDIVIELDAQGFIKYISPSNLKLFGKKSESRIGRSVFEDIHPEDRDRVVAQYMEGIRTKKGSEADYRCRHADGHYIWIRSLGRGLYDDAGEFSSAIITSRNITEHKLAESQREAALELLKKSEANYKQLFDNSPAGIYQIDFKTGKFLKANAIICEYFSCSQEEITSRSPNDILTNESKQLFLERAKKRARGEKITENIEFDILDKNGQRRWLQLNNKYIYDSGEIVGSDVVAHDITERKRIEDALRESEEKHRILLAESPDPIFSFTPEGKYEYANQALAKGIGKQLKDIIGKTIWDIFPKEEADIRFAALNQVFSTGKEKVIEGRVPHEDGEPYYMTTITPIKNTKGEIRTAICSSKDITYRKQAEDWLWESQQQLQVLVDTLYDMVWEIDTQGYYTYISPRSKDILGYDPEEILGKTPFEIMPTEEAQRVFEIFKPLIVERKPVINLENICIHKDGHLVVMETSALPFYDSKGEFKGYRGTDRNITERKQHEEEMILMNRQMEAAMIKANEATLVKSRFLATMSHEIRTPLSGLIGMTGLLLDTPLSDKQRRYAEKISTSGETLLAVLNDILDYSKIEAGKITYERIPFSVERLIDKAVNIFKPKAKEKRISLLCTIDPELPDAYLGSPHHVTQIISNLIGNAVKFTTEGEIEIAVKVRQKNVDVAELEISVRDTGIGMTEQEISGLFIAFSQTDASTTRRFGGTGLGLAISKQLIEYMGGTIRVESTPGKGSIFTIVLSFPIATQDIVADLPLRAAIPRAIFTGVRALVAEDHEINKEILVELLHQAGIDADIAKNGRDAVEKVRAQDYDIIFMDIEMPEMDGLTASREIRNLGKKGVDILPILAMTAHALTGDSKKSLDAGMSGHLTKPISLDALGAALRQWLPPEKYAVKEPDLVLKPDLMITSSSQHLDVEDGLGRLGGNSELYLKLLRNFIAGYGELPEQLLQDLRMERREDAVHRIHAIRGIAGNLGGKELAAAAAELEKSLQSSSGSIPFSLGEPMRVFIDRHEALITAIGGVLVRHPAVLPLRTEGPPGDLVQLRLELERLKMFLKNKEPLPCQEIMGSLLQSLWPESKEVVLAELNRMVSNYRMGDALALLGKEF